MSNDYDPLKVDAYAGHLAEINKTGEVIATEDICNQHGTVLVARGQAISARTTEKIICLKLTKPLHHLIAISGEIDEHSLYKALMASIQSYPELFAIHNQFNLDSSIRRHCQLYINFPIIRQKITVLSKQMPDTFKSSLISAWLCTLIGIRMSLEEEELNSLFLAALTHDIGMLHIDPAVLRKKEALSHEEWRQIQAHVIIGQKILNEEKSLPEGCAKAVLEHHECCDGTGYPTQKDENNLSLAGQVIAMADGIIIIYTKRFVKEKKGIFEIIPILQVNNKAHFYVTYATLVTILRQSELPPAKNISDKRAHALINAFIKESALMKKELCKVQSNISEFKYDENDRQIKALHKVYRLIMNAINGTGILNEGFNAWLHQVNDEKLAFAYREVENASQILKELQFHMKRLTRIIKTYSKQA